MDFNEHTPEEIKKEVARLFDVKEKQVKIFGSRARGENRPDSDLDILIITGARKGKVKADIFGMEADIRYMMNTNEIHGTIL